MSILPFASQKLHVAALDEVSKVFAAALSQNFKNVEVGVVDCPDLRKEPFQLATQGFGGRKVIADIGGVDNLNYMENHGKVFDFNDIAKTVGIDDGYLMGPGSGSSKIVKVNSELMANVNLHSKELASKYSIVNEDGSYFMGDYKTSQFGLMANLLVCNGTPCKTIHLKASVRTGKLNFVTCLRKSLEEQYKDKTIGISGVFNINKGKIKAHVMPDFPSCDLLHQKQVDDWLRFYEMKAPLTCLSVFINNDLPNLGLRLEHTHFFSSHGDAGHYHYDTTPEEVEYEGYFVVCEEVFRVAKATPSPDRTFFSGLLTENINRIYRYGTIYVLKMSTDGLKRENENLKQQIEKLKAESEQQVAAFRELIQKLYRELQEAAKLQQELKEKNTEDRKTIDFFQEELKRQKEIAISASQKSTTKLVRLQQIETEMEQIHLKLITKQKELEEEQDDLQQKKKLLEDEKEKWETNKTQK